MTIPKLLKNAPILMALAEVRFSNEGASTVGAVLPGVLYSDLKDEFPTIEPLPTAQIPSELTTQNPELRYLPTTTLRGEGKVLSVGGCVLALSFGKPYPGWDACEASIKKVWDTAKRSGLIGNIERFSLKYVNLIEADLGENHLALTTVKLVLGDRAITSEATTVRTEIKDGRFITIMTIVGQAHTVDQPATTGLIVDLDVVCNGPFAGGWDEIVGLVNEAHAIEKNAFFGLLTKETIDKYGPDY